MFLIWLLNIINNQLPIGKGFSVAKHILKFFIFFNPIFFFHDGSPEGQVYSSAASAKRPLTFQWPMLIILFFLYDDGELKLYDHFLCSFVHGSHVLFYVCGYLVETFFSSFAPPLGDWLS